MPDNGSHGRPKKSYSKPGYHSWSLGNAAVFFRPNVTSQRSLIGQKAFSLWPENSLLIEGYLEPLDVIAEGLQAKGYDVQRGPHVGTTELLEAGFPPGNGHPSTEARLRVLDFRMQANWPETLLERVERNQLPPRQPLALLVNSLVDFRRLGTDWVNSCWRLNCWATSVDLAGALDSFYTVCCGRGDSSIP